jgi:hypothetical protein
VQWDLIRATPRGNRFSEPGTYRVVLTVNGQETSQPLKIETDPTLPANTVISDEVQEAGKKTEKYRRDD